MIFVGLTSRSLIGDLERYFLSQGSIFSILIFLGLGTTTAIFFFEISKFSTLTIAESDFPSGLSIKKKFLSASLAC